MFIKWSYLLSAVYIFKSNIAVYTYFFSYTVHYVHSHSQIAANCIHVVYSTWILLFVHLYCVIYNLSNDQYLIERSVLSARLGRESCNSSDICPDNMTCRHGQCTCYVGEMTSDGLYCLKATQKLLGQKCMPITDTCLQKASKYACPSLTHASKRPVSMHAHHWHMPPKSQ